MKYCAHQLCDQRVVDGYCPAHARTIERARGSSNARGYTYRWQQRAARFRAHYPLCGMRPDARPPVMSQCHDEGRITPAYQVDHIVPHRGDLALFWDELNNWQSLCAECGARKTAAGL
jgi:5-methylcytosine-specific restriction protein A